MLRMWGEWRDSNPRQLESQSGLYQLSYITIKILVLCTKLPNGAPDRILNLWPSGLEDALSTGATGITMIILSSDTLPILKAIFFSIILNELNSGDSNPRLWSQTVALPGCAMFGRFQFLSHIVRYGVIQAWRCITSTPSFKKWFFPSNGMFNHILTLWRRR